MSTMNNKIGIVIAFVFILHNNSKGQPVITNNTELNMKSHTENAELLKKNLEENLALELKEANKLKDRMKKILNSDLKGASLFIDSLREGLQPKNFRYYNNKEFFLQKEGKNIRLNFSLDQYEETSMSQDNLKDFVRIEVNPDGKIYSYSKQEQNKTIKILFSYDGNENISHFTKEETEKDSLVEHISTFYPDGKLNVRGENKYKNIAITYDKAIRARVPRLPDTLFTRTIDKTISYLYDENGNLIEISEYDYDDSLFEFTMEDVKAYIKKENFDNDGTVPIGIRIIKFPQKTVNGEIKSGVYWHVRIRYVEGSSIIRDIYLNGKTGEKFHESVGYNKT